MPPGLQKCDVARDRFRERAENLFPGLPTGEAAWKLGDVGIPPPLTVLYVHGPRPLVDHRDTRRIYSREDMRLASQAGFLLAT
jgi:hypothetical protein